MIPVIETERLRLRAPEPGDETAFEAFFIEVRARFMGGPPQPGRGFRILAAQIGHWTMRGVGSWVYTRRGDDTAIGFTGAWHPADWPEPEIGWAAFAGAEGRGFAHEAAVAARKSLYRDFGWTTAVSYIDPDNHRSIRLAERLGCKLDIEAAGPSPADLVYRHPGPAALS